MMCVSRCRRARELILSIPIREYSLGVTLLASQQGLCGTGLRSHSGKERLICEAIEMLARPLVGRAIEELMADFGHVSRKLSDDPSLRSAGAA